MTVQNGQVAECGHCTRKTELYLCASCAANLAGLLEDLPWLCYQLEVTVTRRDRLDIGVIGRSASIPAPANLTAAELAWRIAETLRDIMLAVNGDRHPFLGYVSAAQMAVWLKNNVPAIAAHPKAGEYYQKLTEMIGDPHEGPLHAAINRQATRFAGPCPSVRSYDHSGLPVRCGHLLYAHDGDDFVLCRRCGGSVDVEANRRRAATAEDLLPAEVILEAFEYLGEPIRKDTFYGWITSGKLRPQGFLTARGRAKRRSRPSDPRVYSMDRARALATRELQMADL